MYFNWPGEPFNKLDMSLEDDRTRMNHVRTGCKVWIDTGKIDTSNYLTMKAENKHSLVDAVVGLTQMIANSCSDTEPLWEAICWVQPPKDGFTQFGASVDRTNCTFVYKMPADFRVSEEDRASIRAATAQELQELFAKVTPEMINEPGQMQMRLHLGRVQLRRLKANIPDVMSYGELNELCREAYRYHAKELEKRLALTHRGLQRRRC